ncbi:hypothetical protein HispidOSU_019358, partial [Sigmodon hispidus]
QSAPLTQVENGGPSKGKDNEAQDVIHERMPKLPTGEKIMIKTDAGTLERRKSSVRV